MEKAPWGKAELERYEEFGYAVLRNLIPASVISDHLGHFERLLAEYGVSGRGDIERTRTEDRARFNEAIGSFYREPETGLGLCRCEALHRVASAVFKKESVAWGPVTVIWGGGAIPHRDVIHYRDPANEAARFWVALEDLHPESGLLYVVPGSHRNAYRYDEILAEHPEFLGILQYLAAGNVATEEWQSAMKPILDYHHAESAEIAGIGPKELLRFNKGDVLMFNPAIVHGSLVPADPSLTRKSFIVECRSRDCCVYSMRAYFGSKHDYRTPENAAVTEIVESPLGPYGRSTSALKSGMLPAIVGCETVTVHKRQMATGARL